MRFPFRLPRLSTIGILLLFVAIVVYAGIESRALLEGPEISIETPLDGAVVSESSLVVRGKALHISAISLNDRPIFIDKDGNFSEELLLPPGYTILSVKAEDRFQRKTEKELHIFRNS
jgi:hypothetical protein